MLLNQQSCGKCRDIHTPLRSSHKNHMQKNPNPQQIRIRLLPFTEKGAQLLLFYHGLPKRKDIQMNLAILRCRSHLPESSKAMPEFLNQLYSTQKWGAPTPTKKHPRFETSY